MNNLLEIVLTVSYWLGFWVTLWAVVTDRFRLRPYGLPMSRSAIFRKSVIDMLCTLVWFVYIPAWFVYRQATRHERTHNQL